MRIRRIRMQSFMAFEDEDISMPTSGVVLVTGENGAGKSTIMEAVSFGLWGKTLRGSKPTGLVLVEADDEKVARARTTKTVVRWLSSGKNREADTVSKTQAELEGVILDFNVWRRTHVFSSADAAHFTLATDAERKRLLESILGLDKFDAAHKRCREDLKVAAVELSLAEREAANAFTSTEAAHQRHRQAEAAFRAYQDTEPPEGATERLEKLREDAREVKKTIASLKEEEGECLAKFREAVTRISMLRAEAKSIGDPNCSLCKRPWDDAEARSAALAKVEDEIANLEEVRDSADFQKGDALISAQDILVQIQKEGHALKAQLEAAERNRGLRDSLKQAYLEAEDAVEVSEMRLSEAAWNKKEAEAKVARLKTVEKVLGLRGVRSTILGKALGGIEDIANDILENLPRQGSALQIAIHSTTNKKTGGVSDSISVELEGAGGKDGYQGASGGERRRVDVAILLALMEVSAATQGVEAGTLFLDEVFDSLDEDGIQGICAAIEDLSKERAVVIISHSEHVKKHLNYSSHWVVESGKISRV